MKNTPLKSQPLPTNLAIALLWASLLGLYIYNDYFSLYVPGTVNNMLEGIMGPLGPATDGVLLGVSALLAIPAAMIFLSAALPAAASRWLNLALGALYTLVNAMTFLGARPFYQMVVCLEIAVTIAIFIYAIRWPRAKA